MSHYQVITVDNSWRFGDKKEGLFDLPSWYRRFVPCEVVVNLSNKVTLGNKQQWALYNTTISGKETNILGATKDISDIELVIDGNKDQDPGKSGKSCLDARKGTLSLNVTALPQGVYVSSVDVYHAWEPKVNGFGSAFRNTFIKARNKENEVAAKIVDVTVDNEHYIGSVEKNFGGDNMRWRYNFNVPVFENVDDNVDSESVDNADVDSSDSNNVDDNVDSESIDNGGVDDDSPASVASDSPDSVESSDSVTVDSTETAGSSETAAVSSDSGDESSNTNNGDGNENVAIIDNDGSSSEDQEEAGTGANTEDNGDDPHSGAFSLAPMATGIALALAALASNL